MMWSYFTGLLLFGSIDFTRTTKTVCCRGAGCFSDEPPFEGLPLPTCYPVLDVTMRLYTRHQPTVGYLITRNKIPVSFSSARPTIFFVHGWTGNGDRSWLLRMKNATLQRGDFNAIVVKWDSRNWIYSQSASDTRTVGREISLVVERIMSKGFSADTFRLYCVGHSLGAHICGHAGSRVKFHRITGLDPSALMFSGRPTRGLNRHSAHFVDVIHTDAGGVPVGLGILEAIGHVDFYPNAGYLQPGCRFAKLGCSHKLSQLYYLESVTMPCFKSRHRCLNETRLPSSCSATETPVQSMGFDADKYSARGIFYLTTNKRSPYCHN